eukprot:gene8164-9038_t
MDPDFERRLIDQINGQSPVSLSPNSPKHICSPSPRRRRLNMDSLSDRAMPNRSAIRNISGLLMSQENEDPSTQKSQRDQSANSENKDSLLYNSLLKNELLDAGIEFLKDTNDHRHPLSTPKHNRNLFKFKMTRKSSSHEASDTSSPYSLSPIGKKSHQLLRSPKKDTRKISKVPFKVLDAPDLQDDFYLNLVDWSSQNILSVGLGTCVYLWSAFTSQVTKLCDLSSEEDSVTSVAWTEKGSHLAVGTHKGFVQIWDTQSTKKLSSLEGHLLRVGSLAWNNDLLCSGSRDRVILQKDIRTPSTSERKLTGHRQEVCGLRWSPDRQLLASGGNDNKLMVWNLSSTTPYQQYSDHVAAVKAIAWSPHQHGLLASGGGTVDRCIRFWNTLTGQNLQCIDTGSQVCNLAWSKHSNEVVSTHGYSQNQILVWKYPSLQQVAKLTGHTCRVLYLSMSPDGESIVTGAGDETLRFWNVFSKAHTQQESRSELNLFSHIR